jgi:hypothetical protein
MQFVKRVAQMLTVDAWREAGSAGVRRQRLVYNRSSALRRLKCGPASQASHDAVRQMSGIAKTAKKPLSKQ